MKTDRLIAIASVAGLAVPVAAQWTALPGGPNGEVGTLAVAVAGDGTPARLFLGGDFTSLITPTSVVAAGYVASWDGRAWVGGSGVSAEVHHLSVHPFAGVPTLFAGKSSFTSPTRPLARLSGGQWSEMAVGTQAWIFGLASFDLGSGRKLALSSTFFLPSEYIASWDKGALGAMGTGLITVTKAFAVFDDGAGPRLYAGAGADAAPGLTYIASFDGVQWSTPPGAPSGVVNAMTVYDDGTGPALVVGGQFTFAGTSTPMSRVARFRQGVWSALGAGVNGTVNAMMVHDDGSGPALFVAGDFTMAGGQPASKIAKWRNGVWSALGAGISGGAVLALAAFDDDGPGPVRPALYAAGTFTGAGGQAANRIARWGEAVCYANCDGSSGAPRLSSNDFQCFLDLFASSHPWANCDGSTGSPRLSANDFQCFLNAFAAGCT